MATASKNEFSSFEYLEPANYLPSFDETANLDAWNDAEAQAKANGETRLRNAQQWEKNINQVYQLAPTLAKEWKKQRDQQDELIRNQQRETIQELHAAGHELTLADFADWENADARHNDQTGYLNNVAAQLEATGDPLKAELAMKVRNLSGRRTKLFKQSLALDALDNYENDINNPDTGIDTVQIDRGNGDILTWDSALSSADAKAVLQQWRVEKGLSKNNLGALGDEFLNRYYYKELGKIDNRLVANRSREIRTEQKAIELQAETDVLIKAVKTGNGAQAILDFARSNKGTYVNEAGARRKAAEILTDAVGDRRITKAQFMSIYNELIDHKGFKPGTDVRIDVFDEFNLDQDGTLYAKLQAAEVKAANARLAEEKLKGDAYVQEIKNKIKEEGMRPTELEAAKLLQHFETLYPELEAPQWLKTLHTRTYEDKNDADWVATLEWKVANSRKLEDEDWMYINDLDLKKKWRKIAAEPMGQGLDPTYSKQATDDIDAYTRSALNMTQGILDTKSPEFNALSSAAKAYYGREYRMTALDLPPTERHKIAWENTRAIFESGDYSKFQQGQTASVSQNYDKALASASSQIAQTNGAALTSGILAGTEKDYKIVEQYARDPFNTKVPPIYRAIARIRNKKGYTAWHVMNDQYRSQTGKELPMPSNIAKLGQTSDLVQWTLTRHPSHNGNRRAAIVHLNKGDFSGEDITIPGLTQPIPIVEH